MHKKSLEPYTTQHRSEEMHTPAHQHACVVMEVLTCTHCRDDARHELVHPPRYADKAAACMTKPTIEQWPNNNVEPARPQTINVHSCGRPHDKRFARTCGHGEPSSLTSGAPLHQGALPTTDESNPYTITPSPPDMSTHMFVLCCTLFRRVHHN